MDHLLSDVRYALRQLSRSSGFAALAVLTLALGIGANTALFTVADAIVSRPRPGVGGASSLVWVGSTTVERSRPAGVSYQVADRLRREVPLFERVATIRDVSLSLATKGEPVRVKGQAVSGDYFSLLRTPFALGRGFTAAVDSAEGAHPVAVLNHQTWRTAFEGDSSIVGRTITVNGLALTVLGVTAEHFNGAEHDDAVRAVWVPASMLAVLLPEWRWMVDDASNSNIDVVARLLAAESRPQAEAAVQHLASSIAASDSSRGQGWTLRTYDASAGLPAGAESETVPLATLAFAVTGLILLICCANVSNLMLARALGRQREIATRLSIGASRLRVIRQLLTESVFLATLASVAGLLLAVWGVDLLLATALPLPLDVSLDGRVFAVSAFLALGTGIAFGLAPALHATRQGVAGALRESGTGGDHRRSHLQGGLVVAQVSLSLLLLTMSGLFLRSLSNAQRIDVGFDATSRVAALSVDIGLQRYDSVEAREFVDEVLSRARALPGVESASTTSLLPLTEWSSTMVSTQRATGEEGQPPARASYSIIRPDYFRTMGITLVSGRDFTDADDAVAAPVAIVSATFARQQFAGNAALGARIRIGGDESPWYTVVGIVEDAVVQSLYAPPLGAVYLPLRQASSTSLTVLVRAASADASPLLAPLREVIRALDPALPVHRQLTLDNVRRAATAERRGGAAILAIFGGLALLLAAIGLHGVMSFTVRQRAREVGIRMALGATRRGIQQMFVRRGLRLTLVGGAIGMAMALAATQLLRSLLFGVDPADSITFVLVALLFVVVAVAASWFPARRAALTDPVIAMRAE